MEQNQVPNSSFYALFGPPLLQALPPQALLRLPQLPAIELPQASCRLEAQELREVLGLGHPGRQVLGRRQLHGREGGGAGEALEGVRGVALRLGQVTSGLRHLEASRIQRFATRIRVKPRFRVDLRTPLKLPRAGYALKACSTYCISPMALTDSCSHQLGHASHAHAAVFAVIWNFAGPSELTCQQQNVIFLELLELQPP